VFARYNENVGWGLGAHIADNYAAIVLIDHISRRSSGKYFAKEAIRLTHRTHDNTDLRPELNRSLDVDLSIVV
jgi:hypothetical protein